MPSSVLPWAHAQEVFFSAQCCLDPGHGEEGEGKEDVGREGWTLRAGHASVALGYRATWVPFLEVFGRIKCRVRAPLPGSGPFK